MPATNKVQLKSCVRGHVYLGQECPCEQLNLNGPKKELSSRPASSRSSRLLPEFSQGPK